MLFALGILNIYLDPSVGATQMPPLQQGPLLTFEICFSGFFSSLTHYAGTYIPQGARTVALQAWVLPMPWDARLIYAGLCFMCLPSLTPPLTNEQNPPKNEILVFIIKRE